MLAPINSNKHYVHRSSVSVASAAILNDEIVDAVVAPATAASNQVEEGSIVKAVYIELWIVGEDSAGINSPFHVSLEKKPSDAPDMTFGQSVNLGAYPNKKNILYFTQGIVSSESLGPTVNILRQWFAIPKGKQRMGLGDQIVLNIAATIGIQICGFYTYKEYR